MVISIAVEIPDVVNLDFPRGVGKVSFEVGHSCTITFRFTIDAIANYFRETKTFNHGINAATFQYKSPAMHVKRNRTISIGQCTRTLILTR